MTDTFKIKRSDTKPYLSARLQSASTGSDIDLTGGEVYFNLATADGNFTPIFSGACVITGSVTGQCEYRWTSGNTNRSGTYFGEFEFTSGTDVQTFPSDHSLYVKIYEDLDT